MHESFFKEVLFKRISKAVSKELFEIKKTKEKNRVKFSYKLSEKFP